MVAVREQRCRKIGAVNDDSDNNNDNNLVVRIDTNTAYIIVVDITDIDRYSIVVDIDPIEYILIFIDNIELDATSARAVAQRGRRRRAAAV